MDKYYKAFSMINNYYRQIDIDRFNYIISCFPDNILTILDVGAWDTQFKGIMEMNGYKVTSLDINPQETLMIKADITALPFKDNSFDLVTALETLEHLDSISLAHARRELSRVSSKYIIISVPYDEMPLGTGHKQRFSAKRFYCLFPNNIHTDYFGWRASYKGIRRQLCFIDKRLAYLFNMIFGVKKSIVSNWIIGIFQLKED